MPLSGPEGLAPSPLDTPPAQRWLELCRSVVEAHRELFAKVPTAAERNIYEGIGEGGDRTLAIDRQCEDVVFDQLETLAAEGHSFLAISEERGEVGFGDPSPLRVVIDPIDGSLNARRTLPSHSLSLAVADGPSMADVALGYVYDFGAAEEYFAVRGEGASLAGRSLDPADTGAGAELIGLESARPSHMLPLIEALDGHAYRVRVVGSIAITLGFVAAARLDGMMTARDCRSVDAAAAQLIAREAGAVVNFGDGELSETSLSLSARYPVAAARTPEGLEFLISAQRGAGVIAA